MAALTVAMLVADALPAFASANVNTSCRGQFVSEPPSDEKGDATNLLRQLSDPVGKGLISASRSCR